MNKPVIRVISRTAARAILIRLGVFAQPGVIALAYIIERILCIGIGRTMLVAEIAYQDYLDDKQLAEYKKYRDKYLNELDSDKRLENEEKFIESVHKLIAFDGLHDIESPERNGVSSDKR
jgi:uncharacterized protein YwgA